jgi:hypothetical protein
MEDLWRRMVLDGAAPVVDTLALLGERPRPAFGARDSFLFLDCDEAVPAIRDDGRLTGLVGDLGLGLTKPVLPEAGIDTGAGVAFFAVVVAACLVVGGFAAVEVVVLGAVGFSVAFLTGCALGAAWAVGFGRLVGVLGREGDFAGGFVVGLVSTGFGLPTGRFVFVGLVASCDAVVFAVFGVADNLLVGRVLPGVSGGPAGISVVGSPGSSLGVGVSRSMCLSGLWLGLSVRAPRRCPLPKPLVALGVAG